MYGKLSCMGNSVCWNGHGLCIGLKLKMNMDYGLYKFWILGFYVGDG